ncbi:MAG: type II toxin-antitoxin system RelE/ParE family toxin [Oscillospiraceae bacterium]|jgi:putative addiction module killer protein|nr:type II toxin-antitoxin system RelE/ParE family toxin [Oscillospiraceae bacterium]
MRVDKTETFAEWLRKLKDRHAKAVILVHIDRMEEGNVGKTESVGGGVYEKKIEYGPGYRLYFCHRGKELIVLLCGGDKSSQQDDIERAKAIKKEVFQ